MEGLVKGDVVVVLFPYSDLSNAKRRPALIVAIPPGNDLIVCQITSRPVKDKLAISLFEADFFYGGSLNQTSNIRPQKLFTVDKRIVAAKVGIIKTKKMQRVIEAIIDIFT